jgi:hypothetical protein
VQRIKENLESIDVSLSQEDIQHVWDIAWAANKSIMGYTDIPSSAAQAFTDTPPLTTD